MSSSKTPRSVVVPILMALSLVATTLLLAPSPARAQAVPVVINEFVASNRSGLVDNTGEFPDWIELHNTSGSQVNLNGWTLTAGADVHTFPRTLIPANGYLIVFASGDSGLSTAEELHVDFKLSTSGESLVLANGGGAVSSPSWAGTYPPQSTDISYGLGDDDGLFFFSPPSPGAANSDGLTGVVDPVVFSVDHGFYTAAQNVVLSTTTPAATIRYTTDGSTPSATNGTPVSSGTAVTIDDSTVLRAVATRNGWVTSSSETRSYLFAADIVQQSPTPPAGWPADRAINNVRAEYGFDPNATPAQLAAAETALTAIPSVSITTDLENLVDPANGIWTNPRERGEEWERAASIELLDPTGAEPGFEINGGLRIKGNSSRSENNFKHSMRLVFDNDYGDGELVYPINGNNGVDVFESIDLKTAQSWSWNHSAAPRVGRGTDATWVRDVWNRDTLGAMGQLNTESKYVHVYLNGLYWGLYYFEERVADQFAAQYTGGNESDFDVIRQNSADPDRPAIARDGTVDDWVSLWPLVEDHTLTDAEWEQFQSEIDVVSMADFFLLSFLAGDSDSTPRFTLTRSNNWLAVRNRQRVGDAAKWIFIDKDSESALCTNVQAEREPDWNPTPPWDLEASLIGDIPDELHLAPSWLFEAAITRPEFVQIFRDRVQLHMLTPGGALTVSESQARLEPRIQTVNLAIDAEAARWGDTWAQPGFGRANWDPAVQTVRDCFQLRTTVMEDYLREDGLWPLSDPPVIDPAGGAVDFGTPVTISADGGGQIWVTTDDTDPIGADDLPSDSAFLFGGPFLLTESTTVRARILDAGEWSTLAATTYTVGAAGPPSMILNEWNAVDNDLFLKDGGEDSQLGVVQGNGGDWFELVTIEDQLDIRGWTLEISDADTDFGERETTDIFRFRNKPLLSSLRAGTIITVSEDFADDTSYNPAGGDWNLNFQANSDDDGEFFSLNSQSNFSVNNEDWQLVIRDANGNIVFGPAGEGVSTGGVSDEEVGELEADPDSTITPLSAYDDGASSTFGEPNNFDDRLQDFSLIRADLEDNVVPDTVIDSPQVDDVLDDGNVTITGTATDNVGVTDTQVAIRNRDSGLWLRSDGSFGAFQWIEADLASPGATSSAWSFSATLEKASWRVVARSSDAANNGETDRPVVRFSIEDPVGPDTQDPNGEIDAPALDETVAGPTVTFRGTATDDQSVRKVQLIIRSRDTGEFVQPDGSLGPAFARVQAVLDDPETPATAWSLDVDLPDGMYSVLADVRDAAANKDQDEARISSFTVGSEEPDTTLDTPAAGVSVNGPVVEISGSATDNVGVTLVRVAIRDNSTGLWLRGNGTFGAFNLIGADLDSPGATATDWSLSVDLAPGDYRIIARAADEDGNEDQSRPKADFIVT